MAAETNLHSRDSSLNGTAGGKKETLEQLLFARNKKLSSEMAMLRVSDQESQEELQKLREEVSTKTSNLERAQSLNVTLENDLLTLQQEASNQFPMSAKSVSSRYPTSPYVNRNRKGSPTSSIISGFDPTRSPLDIYDSQAVGGGSGILPMVQAQRDRFKQKNLQLENDLSKQYNIVSSLRQEIASLQKDNLNLYEKTRYASTYQRSTPQSSTSAVQINDNGSNMDRYRSAYEANISPFAAFRGRESARAYKRMSMPERLIYSITRLVLANRMSRNLFAAYCVALHLLVFVMLYWVHGADLEKHGSLAAVTAAGAAAAGGPAQAGVGDTGTTPDSSHWRQEGLDGGRPG